MPHDAMSVRNWATLLLLGAIWGGSFFLARVAVAEIAPLTLVLLRVALAAAALWLVVLASGQSLSPLKGRAGALLLLALFNNALPFSLIFLGQTAIGAGLAAILNATTPFWTALIARATGVEPRLAGNRIVGIVIGIAGAAVMLAPGLDGATAAPAWAKGAVIAAALSYGVAATFARRFAGVPPILVATGQLTGSSLLMLPVAWLAGDVASVLQAAPSTLAAVLALALVATAFAYFLYFRLIASAGATNAALVTLVVPVSAVMLGTLLLGERLESRELLGMAVILAGLVVIDGRLLSRFRRSAGDRSGPPG